MGGHELVFAFGFLHPQILVKIDQEMQQ